MKRIESIETQLTQFNTQELPNRQRELESKMDPLLRNDELPSFGTSTSMSLSTTLEKRLNRMELNQEILTKENTKLQARIRAIQETRTPTTLKQVTERLDNVIRLVNHHETASYQVNQAMHEMQQAVDTLRQTVDLWNDDYPQQPTGNNI